MTRDSSPEETVVELEQVFVFAPDGSTSDLQSTPSPQPPYNKDLNFNKSNPMMHQLKQNGRLYLSPSDNSVDSVRQLKKRGYLSPLDIREDEGGGRRRHKSEGSVQISPCRPDNLTPNKKNSMYESRSTISGVRFDDCFIGTLRS